MRYIRQFLLFALMLAACAGEHPIGTPAVGGDQLWERGDVVLFMTDMGEIPGAYHFMWRLRDGMNAARPELELQAQSIWSGDIRNLAASVDDQVLPRQPTLVVITTGHRLSQEKPETAPDAAALEGALRDAVGKLKAAGCEVLVLGTSVASDTPEAKTPGNELAAAYNRVCGEVAQAAGVGYVDLLAPCLEHLKANPPVEGKPSLYGGEFRYTAAWHEMMAKIVAKAVGERMSAIPMQIDIQDSPFIERATVEIPVRRTRKGATLDIRYTLDGKDPNKASKKYEKPFQISGSTTTVKVLVTDTATNATATAKAVFSKVKGRSGEALARRAMGLEWGLYQGSWAIMPDFTSLRPAVNGIWHAPELAAFREVDAYAALTEKFGIRFIGYIDIPVEGVYTFETASDDGSRIWIDDEMAVDNDGSHGMRYRRGRVALREGLHRFRLDYVQGGGGMGLEAWWSSDAGIRRSRIPDSAFCHNPAKLNEWNPPPPKKEKDDGKKKEEPKKK
jgi:hypothetical protein